MANHTCFTSDAETPCDPLVAGCQGSQSVNCQICAVESSSIAPEVTSNGFVCRVAPFGPFDGDVYGDLGSINIGPGFAVSYITQLVRWLVSEPVATIGCPHVGDVANNDTLCNYRVERDRQGWRVHCREIVQLPLTLEDPIVVIASGGKTALLRIKFGPGGNNPGNVADSCFMSLAVGCFTTDIQNPPWDPRYWPDDCGAFGASGWDFIDIDLDARMSLAPDADAVHADKPLAWREAYNAVLAVVNTICTRVDHGGREAQEPAGSGYDRWDWEHAPLTPNMVVIPLAAPVRFVGQSTGIVVPAEWVLVFAYVTVHLAPCAIVDGEDKSMRVLSEISVSAVTGIRRTSAWPSGTFMSHGESVSVDFGADLLGTTAVVTLPNGVQCVENLIGQVFDAASGRWYRLPPRARWRGLSAPGPWANPEWQDRPQTCTYSNHPCAKCCGALEAVNGLIVPREPTNTTTPAAPQEYAGDAVLSLPAGVIEGDFGCQSQMCV